MSGSNPYEWLQDLVAQVPEFVQPLIVARWAALLTMAATGVVTAIEVP
ncbi:hypothetical protein [Nonomuraea angiospora]|nr:hypothetical protein [Nonomuraea angiospora]MDX3101874.1 hypothetical protein [Nonomuraea angiospora]